MPSESDCNDEVVPGCLLGDEYESQEEHRDEQVSMLELQKINIEGHPNIILWF